MQTAAADLWSKTTLRIFAISLLLTTHAFAQSPSSASYLDPLPQDTGAAGLKQQLRKLQNTGRLMMVVAHPDDEDGGLLTLEARGQGVQCLLMTLTRGEGGQNETGNTFSDELGVLRTLELLAADRYYGVDQRFSRVADFGYSKTAEETFQKWGGHDVALADIVRVIRQFRPDVLIARFSGTDRDGHGHHQASSILTQEAFRTAADPNRFPEQLKEGLQPWQPKKLYIGNVCGFGASSCPDENWTVKLNTGEEDPVLGMSYVQFAVEGLKHQQSQGLGEIRAPSGPRYAFYKLADSVLPKTTDERGHEKDLFDGIDTSLPGLSGRLGTDETLVPWFHDELVSLAKNLSEAAEQNEKDPAAGAGSLLDVLAKSRTLTQKLDQTNVVKLRQPKSDVVDRLTGFNALAEQALNLALNVSVTATAKLATSVSAEEHQSTMSAVSPGQRVEDDFLLANASEKELRIDSVGMKDMPEDARHPSSMLAPPHGKYSQPFYFSVPGSFCCTRPYWHRDDPARDAVNTIDDARFVTLPLPPYPLEQETSYSVLEQQDGKTDPKPKPGAAILKPLTATLSRPDSPPEKLPIAVIPAFSITLDPPQLVVPISAKPQLTVNVKIESNADVAPAGVLRLEVAGGWSVSPKEQKVEHPHRGEEKVFQFQASSAELAQGKVEIRAELEAGGQRYSESYTLVTREDLGSFYYFQPAVQHISIVDVKVLKDLKIAYIMGAGDGIPTVLQQIGMNVTLLPAERIAGTDLSQYGTIVLGVRAYDTQKDLVANNQKLLDFVSNGGTLIVQNNNSVGNFNGSHFTPYPAELSRARVSVEEAPVQILAPDDPILHYPNEISQKDFDGWVQERGLYFMSSWDDHFKPLLSCHDPNEPDQKGGLLEAKYGKGTYIYTGYAFFRQLPAGVPGAIRLFVNLVSAGANH